MGDFLWKLQDVIAEVHQDLGDLGTGGRAGGIQTACALAVDHVVLNSPAHGVLRPGGNLGGILVATEAVRLAHVVALELGVAVEDGGHLLAGHRGVGIKLVVAFALDNAACGSPVDGVGVPGALGHIVKHGGIGAGGTLQVVEYLGDHGPGQSAVGVELAPAHAVHEIVVIDELDGVIVPGAAGHVGEEGVALASPTDDAANHVPVVQPLGGEGGVLLNLYGVTCVIDLAVGAGLPAQEGVAGSFRGIG